MKNLGKTGDSPVFPAQKGKIYLVQQATSAKSDERPLRSIVK